MNYFELAKGIFKAIKAGLDLAHEHQKSIDPHHFAEIKGQVYTAEGYLQQLHDENIMLKVENNTLKKMIRDGENK